MKPPSEQSKPGNIVILLRAEVGPQPGPATIAACIVAICSFWSASLVAADLEATRRLYLRGDYAQCADAAAEEIRDGAWQEEWPILKIEAELIEGKYPQALATVEEAIAQHSNNLQLRLLARTAYRHNGEQEKADAVLSKMERAAATDPRRFGDPAERVALGQFLLERGADPRQVLELIYDRLREQYPDRLEAYLASAELAIDKNDFAVAAETLKAAPKDAAAKPHYHFLLSRALVADDPARGEGALAEALRLNPRHVDSLLLRADQLIDAEKYADARRMLDRVLEVNSQNPQAWAYKAVLAHLENEGALEEQARRQALASWPENPEVDHLIGRKLSQKYRFAEGAAYQRRSLKFDPTYRSARRQLSQDLLRLGEEEEGWRLAEEISQEDAYDVVAYNLMTLRDEITKYHVIGDDRLRVRMEAREAKLYGERVLELLSRARDTLCAKYDVRLELPIVVEIFPRQQDFAVRTFGMPGADGFLGVCFGRVITANSPASQGQRPSNWEAILWHEFCHVVTLHKTGNKMPRWLSEGISVYEERQANPAWGQSMTPQYRKMILADEMTPVSELSSAFLAPPSPLDLQFAYFESSLVIEYLIDRYGLDSLRQMLVDLADGVSVNETLIRHTVPLGRLDADFAAYARKQAESMAPNADWDEPELPDGADAAVIAMWIEKHPNNYIALQQLARELLKERKFQEAIVAAERVRELFPQDTEAANADAIAAKAQRELGDVAAEQAALQAWAVRDADAGEAYVRLMEIGSERGDWALVAENARRMLAVNPLVPAPHRYLAEAAEHLGERAEAITAREALLGFETTDVADAHFQLARLLRDKGELTRAKRHALASLEEAPRHLAAHRLLAEIVEAESLPTDAAQREREQASPASDNQHSEESPE